MISVGACSAGENAPTGSGEPARHLALGDSYTVGESVSQEERWPSVLARLLEAEGIEADPTVIARTGWTTAELDAAISGATPSGPFDLVTLMIGVNDQFRGFEAEGFRERFAALLDRAIGLAAGEAGRVVVLTIPDWGVTPFGSSYDPVAVAEAIDAFNLAIVDEAAARGVTVVDVTPVTRHRPDLVAGDRLHPSPAMHRLWAELVLPAALDALGD